MNKDIKEDWVEALRSGDYVQNTRGVLDAPDGTQCCLGVLCDIADVDWDVGISGNRSYGGRFGMISNELAAKFGLTGDEKWDLANMNDNGATFDEIADWIEANL